MFKWNFFFSILESKRLILYFDSKNCYLKKINSIQNYRFFTIKNSPKSNHWNRRPCLKVFLKLNNNYNLNNILHHKSQLKHFSIIHNCQKIIKLLWGIIPQFGNCHFLSHNCNWNPLLQNKLWTLFKKRKGVKSIWLITVQFAFYWLHHHFHFHALVRVHHHFPTVSVKN